MKRKILMASLLLLVLGASGLRATSARAIVHGIESRNDRLFFVGTYAEDLGNNVYTACTAVLIDRSWALTAKHCLDGANLENVTLTFGRTNRTDEGKTSKVAEALFPPGKQDIALIRLSTPIDDIRPVEIASPLQRGLWSRGTQVIAAGWGGVERRGDPSYTLRWAKHVVTDPSVTLANGKIATNPAPRYEGKWATHGDSGGPLLHEARGTYTLVGIFSVVGGPHCWTIRGKTRCGPILFNRWGKVGKSQVHDFIKQKIRNYDWDFEFPRVSGVRSFTTTDEFGWRLTRGSIDLVADDYWQASRNKQSLDLNGCSAGRIARQVRLSSGNLHFVDFYYAGNPEGEPRLKQFHVEVNGVMVQTFMFDISGTSNQNMGWLHGSASFYAPDRWAEIAFVSDTEGCFGPVVDNVQVVRVPGVPLP